MPARMTPAMRNCFRLRRAFPLRRDTDWEGTLAVPITGPHWVLIASPLPPHSRPARASRDALHGPAHERLTRSGRDANPNHLVALLVVDVLLAATPHLVHLQPANRHLALVAEAGAAGQDPTRHAVDQLGGPASVQGHADPDHHARAVLADLSFADADVEAVQVSHGLKRRWPRLGVDQLHSRDLARQPGRDHQHL